MPFRIALMLSLAHCATPHDPDALSDSGATGPCPEPEGLPYDALHPQVMLLIDSSGSMNKQSCRDGSCGTRWEDLLVLGEVLPAVHDMARFGLTLFPEEDGDTCSVATAPLLPPRVHHADAILQALSDAHPGGRTPMADALRMVAASGHLSDPLRDNVVVLVSDGNPNCSCPSKDRGCEQDAAVASVTALVEDTDTELYIIGFATRPSALETLERMAAAAEPTSGPDNLFTADDADALVERLRDVTAQLPICRYALEEPVATEALTVTIGGTALAPCEALHCQGGYTYDETHGVVQIQGLDCLSMTEDTCQDLVLQARPGRR